MANQLTKEQMDAIDNYSSQIKTLKDFVTAVRTRPGMYIGPLGNGGLMNMCRECWQNSLDIIIDPNIPGNWIYFSYDERSKEVIVEDNGIGIPHSDIIRILTTQHTSKNYEKNPYQYSSGQNGIGLKATNALAEVMIVESYKYDGTAVRVECHKGYPTKESPIKIDNKSKKQGTKIRFIPDEEILGETNLSWKKLYTLMKRIMSITPIGTSMDFRGVDIDGKEYNEHIVNKDGIITDIIMKVEKPIIKPIVIGADDGTHKLDIAICYDAGNETAGPNDTEDITSFSNYCPTVSGTHVDGSVEGITRWFTLYMNNIYLASQKSKDKIKVNSSDIKTGLVSFVAASHLYSNFIGQSKDILSNEDMIGFCKDTVMKGLDEWSKANPADLQKLCKFFKDIAELRTKQEAGKVKIVTKYQKNPITNLPRKYVRPTNDKIPPEVFIVEGDSALGKAQEDRLSENQG